MVIAKKLKDTVLHSMNEYKHEGIRKQKNVEKQQKKRMEEARTKIYKSLGKQDNT